MEVEGEGGGQVVGEAVPQPLLAPEEAQGVLTVPGGPLQLGGY